MITLKTTEKSEAQFLFEKEGLDFGDNSNCLCAKDKTEVLGYCLFDIEEDVMVIRAIEPQSDLMLLDGVLRSTLHIAASRELKEATFTDKAPEKIFKTLGFLKEDGTLNISKLFESHCNGCGK